MLPLFIENLFSYEMLKNCTDWLKNYCVTRISAIALSQPPVMNFGMPTFNDV